MIEPKTILVVIQDESDYDSNCAQVILATFDQTKAEAKVTEMEERKAHQIIMRDANTVWFNLFDSTNPRPLFGPSSQQAFPIFKGKRKDWTVEQKAEYKRIEKENQEANLAATAPFSKWANLRTESHKAFLATFTQQEQEDWNCIREHTFWGIEEVPFIE